MKLLEKARRVFEIEMAEVSAVAARLDHHVEDAVRILRECVEKRGKIIVMGVGKSGHIGEKISATLTSTGCPSVVLNSLNALHGDLGVVTEQDAVIALSYSGETEELLNVLPAFQRMGLPIIAITGSKKSTLAKAASAVLDVEVSQEACPLNLAPTSSSTAMLVLGDALAMTLLESRGFRKEDFARFHPGGSLGRSLLLRVHQIMRPREELAIVNPEDSVLTAIQSMTAHKAGAAVVVGTDNVLAGIFTHGDFARRFASDPALATREVGSVMTSHPITIRGDQLAAEVLQLLQNHRIDDLVVVDSENRPVGIVDSQDLSRTRLV